MKGFLPSTIAAAAAAVLLAACGGGGDSDIIFEDDDPTATTRNATVLVAAASDGSLNGTYSSTGIWLNNVEKVNPIGGDPELCRYRFSGLQQTGTDRVMSGDIRYIPGNTEVRVTFVSINGTEFRLQGSTGAAVDRTNDEVDYTGAVLTSTQGTGATITLTGSIPMRPGRPEGC